MSCGRDGKNVLEQLSASSSASDASDGTRLSGDDEASLKAVVRSDKRRGSPWLTSEPMRSKRRRHSTPVAPDPPLVSRDPSKFTQADHVLCAPTFQRGARHTDTGRGQAHRSAASDKATWRGRLEHRHSGSTGARQETTCSESAP